MVDAVKSPFSSVTPKPGSLSAGAKGSHATGPDADKKQNIATDMMKRLGKNVTPSSDSTLPAPSGAGGKLDVKG